ncbi:MAG TPA: L-histidine N(alpha)-methyltransferase [Terriglobia bacterium]|nr:L-histidine N(alpha)-methyltransferase [Terriglobia bacterium]
MLTQGIIEFSVADFANDVRAGLSRKGQKELPSKYLYDDIGSALFDVICLLPEYSLTRADERILQEHAEAIMARVPSPVVVAELGSGNARKTRGLLEALCRRQPTTYYPIEISRSALATAKMQLQQIECISVVGFEKEYLDGLLAVAARRPPDHHILVLFLGSTIGNFDRPAGVRFLGEIRRILKPGDAMLLSTDLEKSISELILAYDDPLGVTAAFNLNLLARINRELEADFNLGHFEHVVRFDHAERRIEMHLRSTRAQTVSIPRAGLSVHFRKDETIWTESSHKYTLEEVSQFANQSGFRCDGQWADTEWPFAESLFIAE